MGREKKECGHGQLRQEGTKLGLTFLCRFCGSGRKDASVALNTTREKDIKSLGNKTKKKPHEGLRDAKEQRNFSSPHPGPLTPK